MVEIPLHSSEIVAALLSAVLVAGSRADLS